jgi:hypothetical protein
MEFREQAELLKKVLGLKKERKKTLKSIKLTANCYELLSIIKGE